MTNSKTDVLIIGAGIIGLAQAYVAARAGKTVRICERHAKAQGASVRNFGMVWPIGMPPGELRTMALRSRSLWIEFLEAADLWHRKCGSLHLAYHEDEMEVLSEFATKSLELDYNVTLLNPIQVAEHSPIVRQEGLLGAMYSDLEVCVDPRQVVSKLPAYLSENYGVDIRFDTAIVGCESGCAWSTTDQFEADDIRICNGADFECLYPEVYARHEVDLCKLQMLRARPKSPGLALGPHLCAGLTQLHYQNFSICDSVKQVRERVEAMMPAYVDANIHVLVSQHQNGDITIGDSHEYGSSVSPFAQESVYDLILAYLDQFLPLEQFDIVERWIGVYAKCRKVPFILEMVAPGVQIVGGVGGVGMTLSFGLADHVESKAPVLASN